MTPRHFFLTHIQPKATFMENRLCTPCANATGKIALNGAVFVFLLTIASSVPGMWRMLDRKKGERKQKPNN